MTPTCHIDKDDRSCDERGHCESGVLITLVAVTKLNAPPFDQLDPTIATRQGYSLLLGARHFNIFCTFENRLSRASATVSEKSMT